MEVRGKVCAQSRPFDAMVGQRVDQSRFGVRVVAVAFVVVVLCFWHPETNGYLAIPNKKAIRTKPAR